MNRRVVLMTLLTLFAIGAGFALQQPAAAQTLTRYESQPDSAALYLGDLAYIQDAVTLPADEDVQIILPPGALAHTLTMTEDGARVRSYRRIAADDMAASAIDPNAAAVVLPAQDGNAGTRSVMLSYLARGASWEPVYDMTVLGDDGSVLLGFDAEIRSAGFSLAGAEVRLVAARPGDQSAQPEMTVTQANVGYEDVGGAGSTAGAVQVQHVYAIGEVTLLPGEALRWNLAYEALDARRLLTWDARFGQRVDVIYKVQNTAGLPLVAGPVRVYEDGLFVGQDPIEFTPDGSEGSVTVVGVEEVRVRRTESVESFGSLDDLDYRHDVVLSVTNHAGQDAELIVLDEWNPSGYAYEFSREPIRQGNNVLRWEVTVPAGEQLEITYTYNRD